MLKYVKEIIIFIVSKSIKIVRVKVIAFLLLLFTFNANSQSVETYSSVSINLQNHSLQQLSSLGIGIDHYHLEKESVHLVLNNSDIQLLNQHQIQYKILNDDLSEFYETRNSEKHRLNEFLFCNDNFNDTVSIPEQFNLGTMGGFLTYNQMLTELDSMAMLYPNLITLKQPISTFNTEEGNSVFYVKISDNPNNDESINENQILYTALHHAREPMSMQQLIFYMQYLLENYDNNQKVKNIVDNLELYFVPCINPDGYLYNETTNPNGGGMWRKNRRDNGDGTFGVDLNRNYGYEWGIDDLGSSPNTSSDAYRGSSAFSEEETQAIRHLCVKNDFKVVMNYHSYSNVLLCPSEFTNDSTRYTEFAKKITENNKYSYGTSLANIGYSANGDSDAWMYGEDGLKAKNYAFTPEVGSAEDGFWPMESRIIPLCKENVVANMNAAESAFNLIDLKMKSVYSSRASDQIKIELTKLGLENVVNVDIELLPSSDYSITSSSSYNFKGFSDLETKEFTFDYKISQNLKEGDQLKFDFIVLADNVMYNYSVYRIVTTQLASSVENFDVSLANWNLNQWGVTNRTFKTFPNSITDSPSGRYSPNSENELIFDKEVNLVDPQISKAFIKFYTKWDTEDGYDYVQLILNDGVDEYPLCGNYTNNGVAITGQPEGEPLYDGLQKNWVEEYVDITDHLGKIVTLKFKFVSDGANEKDGFYVDDFKIYTVKEKPLSVNDKDFEFNVYPNPVKDFFEVKSSIKLKSISVCNVLGAQLFQTNSNKVDMSGLNKGVYLVKILDDNNNSQTKRIIKK